MAPQPQKKYSRETFFVSFWKAFFYLMPLATGSQFAKEREREREREEGVDYPEKKEGHTTAGESC